VTRIIQPPIVCPLYEPFLTWLYTQDTTDLDKLPDFVEIDVKDAPFAMSGYRRSGPEAQPEPPAPRKRDKKKAK